MILSLKSHSAWSCRSISVFLLSAFVFGQLARGEIVQIGNSKFTVEVPSGWSRAIDGGIVTITKLFSSSPVIELAAIPPSEGPRSVRYLSYDGLDAISEALLWTSVAKAFNGKTLFSVNTSRDAVHQNFYDKGYRVSAVGASSSSYELVVYVMLDGYRTVVAIVQINSPSQSVIDSVFGILDTIRSNHIQNPLSDSDGDGLTNFDEEVLYQTDPYESDTNGDGLPDGALEGIFSSGEPVSATVSYLKDNPDILGLYNADDLFNAIVVSRELGQQDVTQSPSTYNLFTSIDLEVAVNNATQAIILDPSSVGLFSGEKSVYFSFGKTLTELDKDSLTLDWRLMRTEDLSIWEEIGKVEISIPKQDAPYFFRFELNE